MALCEGNLAKENGLPILKVNVLLLSRTHSIVIKPTSLLSSYEKKQLNGNSRFTHVIAYAFTNGKVPPLGLSSLVCSLDIALSVGRLPKI
jgi:hypothetical protein